MPLAGTAPAGGHLGRGFWLLLHLGFLCCFSPASGRQGWVKDTPFFCGLPLSNASANPPQGLVPSATSYEFTHPFIHLSTHSSIYSFKRCLLSCILRTCTRLFQSLHPEGDRQLAQKTMVGGITLLPPNAHTEGPTLVSLGMGGQEGFWGQR